MAPAPPSRIRILSFSHFTARLGLPKRGRGIKITPRKRCKALNPPKGANGSPRRGYYYGSCPSEPNPHFKFFPLYRPPRLAEARAGHKNNTSQEVQSIESPERSQRKPPQGVLLWLLPLRAESAFLPFVLPRFRRLRRGLISSRTRDTIILSYGQRVIITGR